MKDLGRVALSVGVALAARALSATADPPIWYCDLTGAGYQYLRSYIGEVTIDAAPAPELVAF